MNYRLILSVLACLAFAEAQNSDLPVINTPSSVVQCLPSLLSFSGGSPPYTVSAIPAGQVGAPPLADLGTQTGTSFTWNVALPAGTGITLQIRDSRGVINYSQAVNVQSSSDSSCLNSKGNSNPSTPTSAASPVATSTSSTNPAATSSAAANSTSGAAANSTTAASNSTVPATSKNSTATTPTSTSPSVNQPKNPSVFTPPNTSNLSNSTSPSNNASNGAACGTSVHYKGLVAGLAIAGVALTIFT